VSKQRRGKRKKGRGPRPPKPPSKRSPKRKTAGAPAGAPTAAEIAAWNAAAGEAGEGFGEWSEEDASQGSWSELSEDQSRLATLLGEFVEAFPAAGTLNQVQVAFEAVCRQGPIATDAIRPWAAGVASHVATNNSAPLTPAEIDRHFGLPPGESAKSAVRVAAALGGDAQA
jgi:hypothetical protein